MGLLDDAIREHLELKRQHGGDPSEIERQEREAFGATARPAPTSDAAAEEPQASEPAAVRVDDDATMVVSPEAAAPPADEVAPPAEAAAPPTEEVAVPPEPAAPAREEPVDEVPPPRDARRDAEEDPWLVEETADPEPEPEEDVLEETPDFLQETPEHDRLWFEQKPPRDFDWDK
jgi:hypothetical protein